MNLIEKLGLEKCKAIVDGAPEWATGFVFWTGKIRYLNGETNEIYSVSSKEWHPANIMVLNLMIPLNDLRTALADHERTDTCTDIKNHIAPTTVVIER